MLLNIETKITNFPQRASQSVKNLTSSMFINRWIKEQLPKNTTEKNDFACKRGGEQKWSQMVA